MPKSRMSRVFINKNIRSLAIVITIFICFLAIPFYQYGNVIIFGEGKVGFLIYKTFDAYQIKAKNMDNKYMYDNIIVF